MSDDSCSQSSVKSRAISFAAFVALQFGMVRRGIAIASTGGMFQPSTTLPETSPHYSGDALGRQLNPSYEAPRTNLWLEGIQHRWRRERRRRKVGRAYDMALEIARLLPAKSPVLDVGCGNSYIAHHLSAMLQAQVIGLDLDTTTEAAIDYRRFDGRHFPVADRTVEAVLLCYVLHHAQDLNIILSEASRVLICGGQVIIYEDIPSTWWDRVVCATHNLKWRKRTGPCTFRREWQWHELFVCAGFEIITERRLSRCRNLAHPVQRRLYVIKQAVTQSAQA